MRDNAREFLFELLNTPSPTGFEWTGQRVWSSYVRNCTDAVRTDAYGTAWATLDPGGSGDRPSVMLEAHADEIGFTVRHIADDGFIYISRLGGSDRAIARGKRVTILTEDGPVKGVIGNVAIHLRDTKDDKVPEWHDLYVDIGASKKEEVAARGIRIGNPIVYADGVEMLGEDRLIGRALDNRIGGYIVAESFRRVAEAGDPPACVLHAVNAVQEEIGGYGARMIAYRLHPTVAVVVDVTHATDSPGINQKKHGTVELGKGPTVTHGAANHPAVVRRLVDVAEKHDLPLQHEAVSTYTGTDTDDIFVAKTGVPSALVSLPMRYMHSTIEMVDISDVERCIDLLAGFVQSVAPEDTFHTAR